MLDGTGLTSNPGRHGEIGRGRSPCDEALAQLHEDERVALLRAPHVNVERANVRILPPCARTLAVRHAQSHHVPPRSLRVEIRL